MSRVRIGVVGGGATALWLAREAAISNFQCSVLSERPMAAYASTRNQGWLQSGAFYAMNNDPLTAISCRGGAIELVSYCPEAVATEIPCYFLFRTEDGAYGAAKRCENAGIDVDVLLTAQVSERTGLDRITEQCSFAIRAPDRPMDAWQILGKVAREARGAGVEFVDTVPEDIEFKRTSSGWSLRPPGGTESEYDAVVLACGPLVNRILGNLEIEPEHAYETTKIGVMAVPGIQPRAMLVWMDGVGANIVPYVFGRTGFTACVTIGDVASPDLDEDEIPGERDELRGQVSRRYGLTSEGATFHACHKLSRVESEETRSAIVDNLDDNLLFVYPGKFTTARIAARMALEKLGGSGAPPIQEQPYR